MSKFHFDKKAQVFRSRKSAILEKMANNAVHVFKVETFDNKSFDGRPWKPNKVSDGGQQLVKTGRMRQSITILRRSTEYITVGSNVPYAAYHNSGTNRLPQRKFIGKNRALEQKNKKLLIDMTKNII